MYVILNFNNFFCSLHFQLWMGKVQLQQQLMWIQVQRLKETNLLTRMEPVCFWWMNPQTCRPSKAMRVCDDGYVRRWEWWMYDAKAVLDGREWFAQRTNCINCELIMWQYVYPLTFLWLNPKLWMYLLDEEKGFVNLKMEILQSLVL